MSKNEFLIRLKEALMTELSSQMVDEHITFYHQYIDDEICKGRSETDVVAELGDPWIIARNILSMQDGTPCEEYTYGESDSSYERVDSPYNSVKVFQLDSWWKKALLWVMILAILSLIFTLITGFLSLVLPILIPVIAIMFIINLLKR